MKKFHFYVTHGLDGFHTNYWWTLEEARAGLAELNAVHSDDTPRLAFVSRVDGADGAQIAANEFGIVTLADGDDTLSFGVSGHAVVEEAESTGQTHRAFLASQA